MTLGRELRVLDSMNKSRLWMICVTLSRELKVVDALNNSTFVNDMNDLVSYELKPLNAMNKTRSSMT